MHEREWLTDAELKIMNVIYCDVLSTDETIAMFGAIMVMICPIDFKKGEYVCDWKTGFNDIPWNAVILLGGSTGSGKSVLLKLLLMQALRKGAAVYIADFKGGVDFPPAWRGANRPWSQSAAQFFGDLTSSSSYSSILPCPVGGNPAGAVLSDRKFRCHCSGADAKKTSKTSH